LTIYELNYELKNFRIVELKVKTKSGNP